jgi:hypothetical protein
MIRKAAALINFALTLSTLSLLNPALAQRATYPAARHGGNYMFNYYIPPAPSATPWAPAWSPDGTWIAAAIYGSIWRVDPATGIATELTYNRNYHSSPAFSRDGEWLVYTSDDDANSIQLEIVNLKSGQSHALTEDSHLYLDPAFSPDGTQLAYVSTQPNGYFNVFVRSIRQGSWAGAEVALTQDNGFGRDRLYFGPWDMHIQPAWLPGGKELLMLTNRGVPLGSGDIWRIPMTPAGLSKGWQIFSEQTLYRTRPDVSPDGKRFIYSSTGGAADQYNHLYVLPVDGGAPYKLTFGEHDDFHPRWSPDGEKIAFISNRPRRPRETGLPELWLLEAYGGRLTKVEIRELRWKRPMGRVQVRVQDTAGKLAAARIYGLASDGKFYAPRDSYSRIGELGEHLFHTGGKFEMELPPGRMTLEAVKGFETWPATQTVEITPGTTAQVTLSLKPMVDFAAKGWISGSTHVHMNYGGNLRNTLENLMFMSRAEDQDVVNELIANKDNRILDWQYFVPGGGEHPVSANTAGPAVIVGEEYRPPFYGHVFFIGLRDHLINPFTTGYEGTAIESLYPSNTDMFRKARAQGAAVGYVHAFAGEADPLESDLGVARAFPVDAALGAIDAMEWSAASGAALNVWQHALNNDLPIAAVGGEDSITNLHRTKLVGTVRTYAYVGRPGQTAASAASRRRSVAQAWIEALKQGQTFMTTGPLLDFTVNGRRPGETVQLAEGGGELILNGQVWSIVPLKRLAIFNNGKVWKEIPLTGDRRHISFEEKGLLRESSWFSLVAEGDRASHPIDAAYPQAVTSAIRAYVGSQKIRNRESAEYFIRWIDKLQRMAESWPGFRSQKERDHVFGQFREARLIYERFAVEARPQQLRPQEPENP